MLLGLCWLILCAFSSVVPCVNSQSNATSSTPIEGTSAVCPAGNSFNATFTVPSSDNVLPPNANVTVAVTGSCSPSGGNDSSSWTGSLRLTNQVNGHYVEGTCGQILLESASADSLSQGADLDVFYLTECYNGSVRRPITTAAAYTLANGTSPPAGTAASSTGNGLSYLIDVTFSQNTTDLIISDSGWFDSTANNYTSAPDPIHNQLAIAECLLVNSTYESEYDALCNYNQCLADNGTCDQQLATGCSFVQCPVTAAT